MDKMREEQQLMTKLLSGLMITLLIALISYQLGIWFPIMGGPIFAITIGIVIGTTFPLNKHFSKGINYSSKQILKLAIILIGFNLNLYHILQVGSNSILIIISTLITAFIIAYIIGKWLKIEKNTSILIGVGTAICGGSAIAATAPVIHASDDEISYSISTIFLFNIVAVFLFPPLGHLFGLSDNGFGMWSGTAINDTSSVVAASYSFSNQAGDYATIVKLTRTLMIIPITLALSIYTSRNQQVKTFNLTKIFPFFILGFLLTSILNTYILSDYPITSTLTSLGKFLIIMAMAGIGLKTNLQQLINKGYKPILLGLSCWFGVASVSLLIQSLIGLL